LHHPEILNFCSAVLELLCGTLLSENSKKMQAYQQRLIAEAKVKEEMKEVNEE
jgi:hypothetical protein